MLLFFRMFVTTSVCKRQATRCICNYNQGERESRKKLEGRVLYG